jgi:hypothetical protein
LEYNIMSTFFQYIGTHFPDEPLITVTVLLFNIACGKK